MNHPHIAQVFRLTTTMGRPYFVAEYRGLADEALRSREPGIGERIWLEVRDGLSTRTRSDHHRTSAFQRDGDVTRVRDAEDHRLGLAKALFSCFTRSG
jgi:hypothetical protein